MRLVDMSTGASTEPLLTISAFARAVDLAPSTLRYYDEARLLTPAEVDPRTGYRYYTPDLERRAGLIRRMREVGLSVDAMRLVLAGGHDEAARILRAHVEGKARSAAQAAAVVDEILTALDVAPAAGELTVTIDGAELAASLRRVVRAASPDEEPHSGVLLDCADGAVTAVATDRYWLALWSVPVGEPDGDLRTFVPLPAVPELAEQVARRVTASLTVSARDPRRPRLPLVVGPVLAALGGVALALAPSPVTAYVAATVMGIGTAVYTTHVFPLYVLRSPEDMMARFQSVLILVQLAMMLLGNLLAGGAIGLWGVTPVLLAAGGVCAAAAVPVLASRSLSDASTH
jgi:DNA-binding transcriptional MerR regulator